MEFGLTVLEEWGADNPTGEGRGEEGQLGFLLPHM